MRVLVCGGRDYNDVYKVYRVLNDLCEELQLTSPPDEYGNYLYGPITIIHGGAPGADALADQWAIINWNAPEVYEADWETHGNAAGPIRNKRMLEQGKPELVIAFPGGKGTENMVKLAKEAGVPVREIE